MMTRERMLHTCALAGTSTLLAVLALTGCTAAETEPTPQATASAPSALPSDSASASATPSTMADDDPACLLGAWTMDQQALTDFYDQIGAISSEAGMTFTPDGSAGLEITADTFTWTPDLTLAIDAAGTPMSVEVGGSMSGDYTATPGHLTTGTTSVNDLVIVADAAGKAIDAGAIAEQIAGAPLTDATFTCTDETLVLETAVADGTAIATLSRD
ncbi:hypothetical protein ACFQRL_10505 [Microbacterium fluvii]|uniref:Lipoprotein n=1 Tax=Microbacterium fluvii TaxID=415215 RepID=A0ABW2HE39_9MICO|nr:hypothetical protein [Microbacterium fluvii]MCU4673025.1 hypothetical protein [Microbacterium fluvii]